ncbi:hypothetical protein [Jongsikchunia kroppenstedtii]|uniref:hypothetical protein n=1 Tax=Jongsikchunia kroppenstedtii TaxID=1121721 RepID=UPI00037E6DBE|nr:hypothetical protein [Jongsikchunia kroppenstedtii]
MTETAETTEPEGLEQAVAKGRRRLLRDGIVKRGHLRTALGKHKPLVDEVASMLVESGLARRVETVRSGQRSWRLVLMHVTDEQLRRADEEKRRQAHGTGAAETTAQADRLGPLLNPLAERFQDCADSTSVVYRLVDLLVAKKLDGPVVGHTERGVPIHEPDLEQVMQAARAAAVRLGEIGQRQADRVATETVRRMQASRRSLAN